MAAPKSGANPTGEARQVFRQFAWHLAGTLAQSKARAAPGAAAQPKPRPVHKRTNPK